MLLTVATLPIPQPSDRRSSSQPEMTKCLTSPPSESEAATFCEAREAGIKGGARVGLLQGRRRNGWRVSAPAAVGFPDWPGLSLVGTQSTGLVDSPSSPRWSVINPGRLAHVAD